MCAGLPAETAGAAAVAVSLCLPFLTRRRQPRRRVGWTLQGGEPAQGLFCTNTCVLAPSYVNTRDGATSALTLLTFGHKLCSFREAWRYLLTTLARGSAPEGGFCLMLALLCCT